MNIATKSRSTDFGLNDFLSFKTKIKYDDVLTFLARYSFFSEGF